LGAAVFEIKDVKPAMLTIDRIGPALAGTVVAAIVGYFAIIWLTRVVRSGRIWCFSLYLFVLAIVVLSTGARG
jgi:undecaprenyl-diphosphatase